MCLKSSDTTDGMHIPVQGFGDWMTEEDLLVELPGTVFINNYPFVLLETDKVRMQYQARPCSNVPASETCSLGLASFVQFTLENVWLRFCGIAEIGLCYTECKSQALLGILAGWVPCPQCLFRNWLGLKTLNGRGRKPIISRLPPRSGIQYCASSFIVNAYCLQFTLRYVNKGRLDSIVSIESIYDKLRSRGKGMRGEILNVFRMLDDEGSGRVSLDDLVNVIRKFNFDLDEDELIALMGRWDSAKDGFIQYEAFVSTIFE